MLVEGAAVKRKSPRRLRPSLRLLVFVSLGSLLVFALSALAACGEENDALGPPEYVWEGVPQPLWDGSVDGWIQYLGDGHFISEFGVEFFWRDGRFVNADGTMMGLPASAQEHLNSLGVYAQPTHPPTLSPERAALVEELERIRHGLIEGTLAFEWQPAPGSDLPADPQEALDTIEKFAFDPDVVVYLKDTGTPDALIQDIDAMPGVQFSEFTSKEEPPTIKLWLNDRAKSAQVVGKLQGREEVKEVRSSSVDFAGLMALLQNATYAKE
jgi:hypothetical protein